MVVADSRFILPACPDSCQIPWLYLLKLSNSWLYVGYPSWAVNPDLRLSVGDSHMLSTIRPYVPLIMCRGLMVPLIIQLCVLQIGPTLFRRCYSFSTMPYICRFISNYCLVLMLEELPKPTWPHTMLWVSRPVAPLPFRQGASGEVQPSYISLTWEEHNHKKF